MFLFRCWRRSAGDDLDADIEAHLDLLTQHYQEKGMSPGEERLACGASSAASRVPTRPGASRDACRLSTWSHKTSATPFERCASRRCSPKVRCLPPSAACLRTCSPGAQRNSAGTASARAAARWLSAAFGVLALVLASIGLYGVVSYRVELRTQEIGIRLALGASQHRVRAMLLREMMRLVGGGLVTGAVATLALTGLLRTILFELSPRDPMTLASAAVVLSSVAMLAGFLPARRASRLDPMVALRRE